MSARDTETGHVDANESAWRVTALFHFVTNTGSAYPSFIRATRGRYRATWWTDTADGLVRAHWREAFCTEDEEGAPTPAEVLALAVALEAYYRQHVAEFDPKEPTDAD